MKDARSFVGAVLADLDRQTADTVLLLVSELATNCVRHASTPFDVTIEREQDQLRVEVADRSTTAPVMRHPDADQPTGRGLQIIDALAAEWGVNTTGDSGKIVWFALPLAG